MTHKSWIYSLPLLLFFTACRITKRQSHIPINLPDVVQVETPGQQPLVVDSIEALQFLPSLRAQVCKAERMSPDSWQGMLQQALDSLTDMPLFETTQVGLCVFDLTDDKMLYALNPDQRMRPASNQKLVTAIACLDLLGGNYRFRPTVLRPGWGWCWDDDETGITDFKAKGLRWNADTLYYDQKEQCMRDVLVPMMKKSDNLLAECMFWQLPLRKDLFKTRRNDCVQRIDEVFGKAGVEARDYVIADGSGLSLYNYLSPRILLMLLRYAHRQTSIRADLYPSLPVAGLDGTLEKRMKGTPAEGNVHAKTGTVTGVSTLSGYCQHPSGHTLAFCIMNQGIPRASVGRDFQDKICVLLCE